MNQTNRQKKVGQLLQEEMSKLLLNDSRNSFKGYLISVLEVTVTSDLSIAKVYVSIFPHAKRASIFELLKLEESQYRKRLGVIIAKQLRIVPHLIFYLDNTIDQSEIIEKELSGLGENPIL